MGCITGLVAKIFLTAFNIVVTLIGAAVLALAAIVTSTVNKYDDLVPKEIHQILTALESVSPMVMALGLFGVLVACCCSNKLFLYTYFILGCCLVVATITVASIGTANMNNGHYEEQIRDLMQQDIKNYNLTSHGSNETAQDKIYSENECCGVDSYTDWKLYSGGDRLPNGCCKDYDPSNPCNANEVTKIYNEGCYAKLESDVGDIAMAAVKLGIFFGVLLLLCVSALVLSGLKLHVVAGYTILTGGYGTDERDISIGFVVLATAELMLAGLGCLVAVQQTVNYVAGYFVLGVPLACAVMSVAIYQLAGEAGMCDNVAKAMLHYMNYYMENQHVQLNIGRGQLKKECCGAHSYKDWLSLPSNFSLTDVPKTCCLPSLLIQQSSDCNLYVTGQETNGTLYNNIYDRGCADAYVLELGTLPQHAGIVMATIAVMQFGALIAIVLVYGKQFSESLQLARNRIV